MLTDCWLLMIAFEVFDFEILQEAAAEGVKLLCFPESFSFVGAKDGESLKIAEPLDGPIMQRYCSLAR